MITSEFRVLGCTPVSTRSLGTGRAMLVTVVMRCDSSLHRRHVPGHGRLPLAGGENIASLVSHLYGERRCARRPKDKAKTATTYRIQPNNTSPEKMTSRCPRNMIGSRMIAVARLTQLSTPEGETRKQPIRTTAAGTTEKRGPVLNKAPSTSVFTLPSFSRPNRCTPPFRGYRTSTSSRHAPQKDKKTES